MPKVTWVKCKKVETQKSLHPPQNCVEMVDKGLEQYQWTRLFARDGIKCEQIPIHFISFITCCKHEGERYVNSNNFNFSSVSLF
jgi:hypothetical protein